MVTLLGTQLYVFGGEDIARRPLNDFFRLDLESLEWKNLGIVKNTPPAARSAHVSIGYQDRYLLFFGGGSVATCFDDLIVFDAERQRWHTAHVKGRKPSPRAGHSAAVLNDRWYIVGGGNNASGCTDMAYLDLSQLTVWPSSAAEDGDKVESLVDGPDLDDLDYKLHWTIVGTIPDRSYLASEGMSLISIQDARVLVAFGGYNGKYSNAVSLFRPREETPVTQPSLTPSTSKVTEEDAIDRSRGDVHQQLISLQAKLDAASKNAAASKEATTQEMAIMRRQLVATQGMIQEKDKALDRCKTQLSSEQSKVLRLEAEVAELKVKLEKGAEMERELEVYRSQKQLSGSKTGGIWGWVAGE